jgi:hypothetical protein
MENSSESVEKPVVRRLRWYQFSLRSLLIFVTLFAVALALVTTFGIELISGFSGLVLSGVLVLLLALALVPIDWAISRLPYWTTFILTPALYGGLVFAFYVFGEAIDQPHPDFLDGSNWLTHGMASGGQWILPIMAGMFFLISIDAAMQKSRPRDRQYYPRLLSVWRGLPSLSVRWILMIGGLLIVGNYADSVIAVFSAHQGPGGWVWPPKRVFAACHFLWGLMWVADGASRPSRGTMVAAIGYLFMTLLLPSGGVMRE